LLQSSSKKGLARNGDPDLVRFGHPRSGLR
jgi:hypothetical protein